MFQSAIKINTPHCCPLSLFLGGSWGFLGSLTPPPQQSRTHWPHKSNLCTQHWRSTHCGRCAYWVKLSTCEWSDDVGWTLHRSGNAFNSPKDVAFQNLKATLPELNGHSQEPPLTFWIRKDCWGWWILSFFGGRHSMKISPHTTVVPSLCRLSNSPFWLSTTTCLFVLNVFDLWLCLFTNQSASRSLNVCHLYIYIYIILPLCVYKNKKGEICTYVCIYIYGPESKLCMERSAVFRTYGTNGLRNWSCSGPLECDEI